MCNKMHYGGVFFVCFLCFGPDFSVHPECGIIEIFGINFMLYTQCECVTGHKQAGMFLLEDFQEAPATIWLALWGFHPLCYIYYMYMWVYVGDFQLEMFPAASALSRLLPNAKHLFFSDRTYFLTRRSFTLGTAFASNQTEFLSSLLTKHCSYGPLIYPTFCCVPHRNYLRKKLF